MTARLRSRSTVVLAESVPLPAEARLEIADRLAGCHLELAALSEEMRRVQVGWGRRREGLEREIADLSGRVKSGNLESALNCPVEYDVEGRLRVVVHPVSGAVMQESEMTEQDFRDLRAQGVLDDEPEPSLLAEPQRVGLGKQD